MSPAQASATYTPEVEATAIRRATIALVPFLMIGYLASFIDRVNAGFAAFQMNKALGLTHSMVLGPAYSFGPISFLKYQAILPSSAWVHGAGWQGL